MVENVNNATNEAMKSNKSPYFSKVLKCVPKDVRKKFSWNCQPVASTLVGIGQAQTTSGIIK